MESTVGVIGLGIMGGAMAHNLLKNSFRVVGYDPSSAAVQRLVDAGGRGAASIADLVESAEILFTSLPTAASFLQRSRR
jgi:2-hydroxy-3-oxopropionate reductase